MQKRTKSQTARQRAIEAGLFQGEAEASLNYESLKGLSRLSQSVLGENRGATPVPLSARDEAVPADRVRETVVDRELPRSHEAVTSVRSAPLRERGLRILVADCELNSRMALRDLLSKYGGCDIAANGREAVEAFRSARQRGRGYDLICIDIQMPEMGCQEAVYAIRSIEENEKLYWSGKVKIFILTDVQSIKTVSLTASFKALCDARLFKPVHSAKLDEHLRSCGLVGMESGKLQVF